MLGRKRNLLGLQFEEPEKFWKKLPVEYYDLQQLHDNVRTGVYGALSHAKAMDAYCNSLLQDNPEGPLAQEIYRLTTKCGVSTNMILNYINRELGVNLIVPR